MATVLKIGGDTTTDYMGLEDDGSLVAYGDATCYRDELQSLLIQAKNNPSDKIVVDFVEGTVAWEDNATTSDYALMNVQLNHDRKANSTVYPHVHWIQNQNATPNWLIQYRLQQNGSATTTAWTDVPMVSNSFTYVSGNLNQISSTASGISTTGAGVSSILQFRIIRDTSNTSGEFAGADTYTGDADAFNFDVHVEVDMFGSREQFVK